MKFFLTFAMFLLAPFAAIYAAEAPQPAKPNIVFIYADDWGWGDLSCHGHPFLKTPNLDRLASQGTDFQQFNVLNPVCSPSRVAAMTGRYPSRFSINSVFGEKGSDLGMPDWLDPRAPTTPRLLKTAGYKTAHFGKWHMGSGEQDAPKMADYGIDESAVYHGPGPGITPHEIGGRAAQFITENKGHPFFVDVWLHESHLAHDPTPESMEKWKHLDEQKQVYAAVITDGDNAVGKVLDALDKAGIADNTLIFFSSDNGPESTGTAKEKGGKGKYGSYYSIGDTHGLRGRKRSIYEGGVRTPFIVRWPGHTPVGAKNDTTAFSAVDLLPTLCAVAGVTPPADFQGDGESLLDVLNGSARARTRPIFWLHTGKNAEPDWWPRLAVREGNWKLVTTFDGQRAELHQLSDDRVELKDVSKEHPDVTAKLSKMVLDWYATLPKKPDPSCVSMSRTVAEADNANKKKRAAPTTGPARNSDAARDYTRAFDRWDTNKDGLLSLEEYKAGLGDKPNLDSRYKNLDKNGDGKVTRDEFINRAPK